MAKFDEYTSYEGSSNLRKTLYVEVKILEMLPSNRKHGHSLFCMSVKQTNIF